VRARGPLREPATAGASCSRGEGLDDQVKSLTAERGFALFAGGGWLLPRGSLGPREALLLRDPCRLLSADQAQEVPTLLSELAEEQARGHYVAGFLAYEAGAAFGLTVRPPDELPLAWLAVYPRENVQRLSAEEWATVLAQAAGPAPADAPTNASLRLSVTPQEYEQAIGQVRELIAAGDTYQVNYTVRARFELSVEPLAYFLALLRRQPVPYAAFLDLGEAQVLSLSPEQFLRRRGTLLQSMPMKGTRPRSADLEQDAELAWRLITSPKDRAENLMIVDMVRNDLGRVSRAGSVRVPALYAVEPYRTVWQMASTVTGRIRREARPLELLRATFPGASITGAPKYHTMEIIARLETEPRGVYTGTVGLFLPAGGAADTLPGGAALADAGPAAAGPAGAGSAGAGPAGAAPMDAAPKNATFPDEALPFVSGLSRSSGGEDDSAALSPDAVSSQARGPGGDFTCNVAIRTLVHRSGKFRLGVGGGIVWDSEPKDEYQEALNKAAFALLPAEDGWEPPSLAERVRAGGIGLFETLRLAERPSHMAASASEELRRYSDLAAHLGRLASSAQTLGLPFDREQAEQVLLEVALATAEAVVVRLDLEVGGCLRTSTRPLPAPYEQPITLLVSPFRTDPYDDLLLHKTTARLLYDRERRRAEACGYQEALFLNQLGRVTEGAVTNLFARYGDHWVTPPLSDGLLPGIWRARYLAEKAAAERSLELEELLEADEIVVGNSIRGTLPVGAVVVNDLRDLVSATQ
jgi:para-aminobenzoate synthetase/4-amino-4-deoxychorismate lyase